MGSKDGEILKQAKVRLYNELLQISHRVLTKAEVEIAYLLSNDPDVQDNSLRVIKGGK